MDIVYFLILGLVAGWLAGKFTKGSGFGLIGNLIVGVIGAVVGGFLGRLLQIGASGLVGHLIMATIGAVVFLFALKFIKK